MDEKADSIGIMKWHGVLEHANRTLRVVLAVVFFIACFALISTRLGFIEVALPDGEVAHIALFFLPVALGALLLGPIAGFSLGLFSGVVLYVHALLLPLDYFELVFVTPATSVMLTTVAGFGIGVLFAAFLRSNPPRPKRFALIILACIVVSVLYSDGVTEAMSVEGELYGEQHLESLLQGHESAHPRDLVEAIRADVATHAEGAEQSDDITVLVLEMGTCGDDRSNREG